MVNLMPTIYMNRGPCVYVFRYAVMLDVVRLLVTGCGDECWLSFCSLLFVFFSHAFQSGFDLVEDSFSSFGWDTCCWV